MSSQLMEDAALVRAIAERVQSRGGLSMRCFANALRIDAEHLEELAHTSEAERRSEHASGAKRNERESPRAAFRITSPRGAHKNEGRE